MFVFQNIVNDNGSLSLSLFVEISLTNEEKIIFLSSSHSRFDFNKNITLCLVIRYEFEPSSLCCNSLRNSWLNVIF